MSETTYYQRNREVILNRAKDYYENDEERLRKQERDKYRNLSEEENNKKREYGKNRYHNMSEEKLYAVIFSYTHGSKQIIFNLDLIVYAII